MCDSLLPGEISKAGWKKASSKKLGDISEVETLAIFRLMDTSKTGYISSRVTKKIC